jgi:hypothetical protein
VTALGKGMETEPAPEPTPAVIKARISHIQREIISTQQEIKSLTNDRQLRWMDQKQQELNFFLFQMSKELYDLENSTKSEALATDAAKLQL